MAKNLVTAEALIPPYAKRIKLQRPVQANLDRMIQAEKDALIVQLFDVL